jgi:hypothetical protein
MKRTTKYVGLDVHHSTTVASVREETGRVITRAVIPTVEFFESMQRLGPRATKTFSPARCSWRSTGSIVPITRGTRCPSSTPPRTNSPTRNSSSAPLRRSCPLVRQPDHGPAPHRRGARDETITALWRRQEA